jgi:glycosyltransferase involved in cell wall biosynthesis
MRVLIFIAQFHPIVGGAERQTQALARGLISRGHDVVVVTRRWKGWPAREMIDGVPVLRDVRPLGSGPLRGLTYITGVAASLARHRGWADVIHITNIYLEAFVAVAMRPWHGIPIVVRPACAGYYGDLARLGRFRAWPIFPGPRRSTLRAVLRTIVRADAFIANSGEVRDELIAAGFPNERVVRIPNGVNLDRFRPAPEGSSTEARTKLGLPSGPLICFVGRMDPQKGLATLLDAFARLAAAGAKASLVIVGDGPQRIGMEQLAAQLGVAGRVIFQGVVQDVAPYLEVSDVFVLPSVGEGMPNALLEAMSTGLPCVASAIGGCRDVITDRQTGLLVPPEDPTALQRALEELLQSPVLRGRLGAAARQDAVARFGLEEMGARYEACYRAVIAGDPVAVAGSRPRRE